jgi:5'-3' exonuclease
VTTASHDPAHLPVDPTHRPVDPTHRPVDPTHRPGEPAVPALLAVDGNSLGHRGYHSSRHDEQDGRPLATGAVVSMLASAWIHGPYDGIVVGFDSPTNRRKLAYPEYKSTRPPTPPELTRALGALRDHLASCGFLIVEHLGAEADDVMAAAVDACEDRGWRCDVLSSDRDLTALIGPRTRLLRPLARFSDLEVEDEDAVRRKYGVSPAQYVDLAALRGDPSDGLTGATGVGPKIAARLLRDHGSVTGLYASLHDLPPRIEAALREGRDRVERNLLLMAPIPHLEVDIEAARSSGVDPDRVHTAMEPLGLEGAARRFARILASPPPRQPPRPPAPSDPDTLGGPRSVPLTQIRAHAPLPPAAVRGDVAAAGEQAALF